MKRAKLIGVLAAMLSTGVFLGCQTRPVTVEKIVEKPVEVEVDRPVEVYIERPVPVDRIVKEVEYVSVEVPTDQVIKEIEYVRVEVPVDRIIKEVEYITAPETAPRAPLVPITQKIIRRVERNQLDIGRFQYYISESIVMERSERTDSLIIYDTGEGWLEETVTVKQVEILPTTKGVMKNARDTNEYISVIKEVRESRGDTISAINVCFDEGDAEKTLTFKKTAGGERFILEYDAAKKTIQYGGDEYKLRMFNTKNEPYLLVRYYEQTNQETDVQKLLGRPKGPAAAAPAAVPAAVPLAEDLPAEDMSPEIYDWLYP